MSTAARIIRRVTSTIAQLEAGALELQVGQLGLAKDDDVMVFRDSSGAFHRFYGATAIESLISSLGLVLPPVPLVANLPTGVDEGSLCMVQSSNLYYLYNGESWNKFEIGNIEGLTGQLLEKVSTTGDTMTGDLDVETDGDNSIITATHIVGTVARQQVKMIAGASSSQVQVIQTNEDGTKKILSLNMISGTPTITVSDQTGAASFTGTFPADSGAFITTGSTAQEKAGTLVMGNAKAGPWATSANWARFGHKAMDSAAYMGYLQYLDGNLLCGGKLVRMSSTEGFRFETESVGVHTLLTIDGGMARKYVAGENLVRGELVHNSTTVDDQVVKSPADSYDCIGVVYANALSGADVWVVYSGTAYVLLQNSTASTRGYWARTSITTAGRADITNASPPGGTIAALEIHAKEIGHCCESKTAGTDVLAKIQVHFN